MAELYRVDHSALEAYCREIFTAAGLDGGDAQIVARSLVDADLRNVISHGVTRIGNYMDRLQKGGAKARPAIAVVSETPSTALLDGDDCLGSVVAERAVALAREKAKTCGLSYVAVRRSNHYGAAARWAMKLAGDDMIGATGSNVEPLICVTGGSSKGIGNNPFSFAFPTGAHGPVCYDVACSVMAGGKLFDYRREGRPIPEDCFLDGAGNPTTDPNSAALMMPFGGHKGYGLAVVVEMLSSILAGGNYGGAMGSQYGRLDAPNHIAHSFIAIDIAAFRPLEAYKASADGFADYLQGLPRRAGVERIVIPGQLENESKEQKIAAGIPFRPKQLAELEAYGLRAGLPPERSAFLRARPVEE